MARGLTSSGKGVIEMDDNKYTSWSVGLLILAGIISIIATNEVKFSVFTGLMVLTIIATVFPFFGFMLAVSVLLVTFFRNNAAVLGYINNAIKGGT